MQTILKSALSSTMTDESANAHALAMKIDAEIMMARQESRGHAQKKKEGDEKWLSRALTLDAQLAKLRRWRRAASQILTTFPQINLSFLDMRGESRAFDILINNSRMDRLNGVQCKNVPVEFPLPRFAVFSKRAKKFAFDFEQRRNGRFDGKTYSTGIGPFYDGFFWNLIGEGALRQLRDSFVDGTHYQEMHPLVASAYQKIRDDMCNAAWNNRALLTNYIDRSGDIFRIETPFPCHYPAEVREHTIEVSHLFEEILTIAEIHPSNWTHYGFTPRPIPGDPLVIGILRDTAFLIDQFDTTDLEAYVCREFSI